MFQNNIDLCKINHDENSALRDDEKRATPSNIKESENEQQAIRSDEPIGVETATSTNIADLIGEFGNYQLSLTLFAFVRYVCVAMMTNTGPLIAPDLHFTCSIPATAETISWRNATSDSDECYYKLTNASNSDVHKCNQWNYNTTEYGVTLTDTFNLVCGRDWLRSLFQSTVSVGVVIASIVFGSFSDEHGRKRTMNICYIISLLSGSFSIIAPDFMSYAISRSICSMSDLGLVSSLATILVETLGNKHRGSTCVTVYTGWSIGVMIMPWITGYLNNFRHLMLFTVLCHLITLPWMVTVGESTRWLLINGQIKEAEQEIKRIHRWNTIACSSRDRNFDSIELEFEQMKSRYIALAEKRKFETQNNSKHLLALIARSLFGGFFKVGQILKSKELFVTTATIVWVTFNSELMYMLFIMINSDVGEDAKLNYAIGGLMETVATLIAIVLIMKLQRRCSLTATLVIISCSIFWLAFTHQHPIWSVPVLNFTKLAISTLSSLIYAVATELFPTNLRQTGMGLAATLGSCGAVVAPFIRQELTDMIGMTNVMLVLFVLPLSAAAVVPFFLRETKDIELADDIDEIVEETSGKREASNHFSPAQK